MTLSVEKKILFEVKGHTFSKEEDAKEFLVIAKILESWDGCSSEVDGDSSFYNAVCCLVENRPDTAEKILAILEEVE